MNFKKLLPLLATTILLCGGPVLAETCTDLNESMPAELLNDIMVTDTLTDDDMEVAKTITTLDLATNTMRNVRAYSKMHAYCLSKIKELEDRINALENRNAQ